MKMNRPSSRALSLACAIALPLIAAGPAGACGSDPYIGEICVFGYTFCPMGYLPADGRTLPIDQNAALYSLYGTSFGGDGMRSFNLPDLRGRAVVGTGLTPGSGSMVQLGQTRGAEQVALTINNMPIHSHPAQFTAPTLTQPTINVTVNAKQAASTSDQPQAGMQLANGASGGRPATLYVAGSEAGANVALGGVSANVSGGGLYGGSVAIAPMGNNVPVATLPPELGLTVCIAIQGLYPMRP